jgi:Putative zinc-finger
MPDPNKMQCGEVEALISDAIEGKLGAAQLEAFQAHTLTCASCGPLLADATTGYQWLKSLEEVEPPASLVTNILVATTGLDTTRLHEKMGESRGFASWFDRAQEWASGFVTPVFALARQPRFAMSFGMVFFGLSVSLSLAGVKVTDIRHADLRPSAVKRTYYETSGRVVKYYENIRFVYEIESRVREFKKATAPAEAEPVKKDNRHTNDTSQEPEQRQERNYSKGESDSLLASNSNHPPVVMLENTYRRLS